MTDPTNAPRAVSTMTRILPAPVAKIDVGLHYKWIALSNSAPRWLRLVCPYGPKENLGLPTCTWCRDGRLDACAHASALRLQLIQTA